MREGRLADEHGRAGVRKLGRGSNSATPGTARSRMAARYRRRDAVGFRAGERFEMDPLEILGEVGHPFCFFGIKPTLFDAPARDTRDDMSWTAHSFLTRIAHDTGREVRALLGFSWGFTISSGQVAITPPAQLRSDDWQDHLPLLCSSHPAWTFATDLQHPQ